MIFDDDANALMHVR